MNNFYDKSDNKANACQPVDTRVDTSGGIGIMAIVPRNDCPSGSILMAYSEQ
jgi:hypothetical protein